MRITAALIVIAGLFASACGTPAAGSTTVSVALTDSKITASTLTVPAGNVTFDVKNTGSMVHELVVLKTSLAEDKIGPDANEPGKVSEDGNVGETDEMDAGTSKTFSLILGPGHYVLICNEVGHYALGMHATFTVK